MHESFLRHVRTKKLFESTDPVLLAVSGGIDSMVMLHLFRLAGFRFGVAHCNFQLRGAESDADQQFVQQTCQRWQLPFHTIRFDTQQYADQHHLSIQMAARELRYTWFEEIRQANGYLHIATAHHKGDVVETFFINLARGTGIRGLSGIKEKKQHLVRPLLFADRKQITHYARAQHIAYREDSSNASLKYIRNKLRHEIIPAFEEIFGNYSDTLLANIDRLREIEEIYLQAIQKSRQSALRELPGQTHIDIGALRKLQPLSTYLYEFLRPYNFNKDTVAEIVEALDRAPGRQFLSSTHRLVKDRDKLIVVPIETQGYDTYTIEATDTQLHTNPNRTDALSIELEWLPFDDQFQLPSQPHQAAIDADKLHFPLVLRKWQKGDSFYPLGMRGRKKLSDFFSDNKFSLLQKEHTWVLVSDGRVVWVVGHRIDDRFKLGTNTKKILLLRVTNN